MIATQTGDVAKLFPDGTVEIVDRSKDVIKSGGEWISSATTSRVNRPGFVGGSNS